MGDKMADKKNGSKEIEAAWIRELAGILNETGLTEIEVEKGEVRLRVSRAASMAVAAPAVPAPAPAPAATPAPADAAPTTELTGAVPSPMVGTAYLAASPGADAFVKVGDTVSEGQTLMIVEAMKTMNPISSPRSGRVKAVLVQDGQPVEFGEALLTLE